MQNSLVKAYVALPRLRDPALLHRAVLTFIANPRRSPLRRLRRIPDVAPAEPLSLSVLDPDAGDALLRALLALPERQRAVLALRGYGGLEELVWSHRPERHTPPRSTAEVRASSPESVALGARRAASGSGRSSTAASKSPSSWIQRQMSRPR